MLIDLGMLVTILYAIVGIMIIVVLYHALFILVDLRKIMRRFEDLTAQVEALLLKPIGLADQGIEWIVEFIKSKAEHQKKKHHHSEARDEEE